MRLIVKLQPKAIGPSRALCGTWRPWVGAFGALLAGTALLSPAGPPGGLFAAQSRPAGAIYELAFIGSLVGAALAMSELAGRESLVARLSIGERLRLETRVLLLGAAVLAIAPILSGLAFQVPLGRPGTGAIALAFLVLQRACIALVALRLPASIGLRVVAFVALAWWIPALTPPSFLPGLEHWVRLPVHMAQSGLEYEHVGTFLADVAPLAGMLLAARLGRR